MTDRIVLRGDGPHFYLDGREVKEAAYRAVYPEPASTGQGYSVGFCGGWPMLSNALAVHPSLAAQAARDAEAKGVPTDFLDGCPVFRDRDHRKRYMQAYGYYDRDAGYGDAQPGYAARRGMPQRGEKGPMDQRGY